jgi:hypothetical protein
MEVSTIQRKVIKSISEWSVFKIALVVYLIIFILTIIFFGIVALIAWSSFAKSGINLNNIIGNSSWEQLLKAFGGGNLPNFNFSLGTSGIIGIVLFIVFGLIFSVVYAAVATFWTWIFNVILKISGGIEIRYIDKTIKIADSQIENKVLETNQNNKENNKDKEIT